MKPQRCKYKVFSGARWDMGGHQCGKRAKDDMDGFCAIHYPPNVALREKAIQEKWRAESKRRVDGWNREEEMRHRAGCFDALLGALKSMDVFFGSMAGGCEEEAEAAITQCRAAIIQAESGSWQGSPDGETPQAEKEAI